MPQPHGLGRIVFVDSTKSKKPQEASLDNPQASSTTVGREASPFGVKMAPLQKMPQASSVVKNEGMTTPAQLQSSSSPGDKHERHPLSSPVFDIPVNDMKKEVSLPVKEVALAAVPSAALGEGVALSVPIGTVVPNPHQPRIQFSEEKLMELAQSIKEHGILQPLIVTRVGAILSLLRGNVGCRQRKLSDSRRCRLLCVRRKIKRSSSLPLSRTFSGMISTRSKRLAPMNDFRKSFNCRKSR